VNPPRNDISIAVVSPFPERDRAATGSAYFAANLARGLVTRGASVAMWGRADQRAVQETYRTEACWRFGPWSFLDILGAARRQRPDIVHVQHSVFLFADGALSELVTLFLLVGLAFSRSALVVTCHDIPSLEQINDQYIRLHRYRFNARVVRIGVRVLFSAIGAFARKIIVHHDSLRDVLIRDYRVNPSKIHVIPLTMLPVAYQPAVDVRARLGIPTEVRIVTFFGFVAGYKGLDVLLDAMRLLHERGRSDIVLVLGAGKHPKASEKPDYVTFYERIIDQASSMPNVRSVGFIPDSALDDYINASDLGIFPYVEFQGMSGPITQFAAHGRPFVVSRAIGRTMPQLSAAVVHDDGASALATMIERYFSDGLHARAVENECRALGRDIDSHNTVDDTLAVYGQARNA
jgi:glycosyltransferase involved in cell wall biosynthesis